MAISANCPENAFDNKFWEFAELRLGSILSLGLPIFRDARKRILANQTFWMILLDLVYFFVVRQDIPVQQKTKRAEQLLIYQPFERWVVSWND